MILIIILIHTVGAVVDFKRTISLIKERHITKKKIFSKGDSTTVTAGRWLTFIIDKSWYVIGLLCWLEIRFSHSYAYSSHHGVIFTLIFMVTRWTSDETLNSYTSALLAEAILLLYCYYIYVPIQSPVWRQSSCHDFKKWPLSSTKLTFWAQIP